MTDLRKAADMALEALLDLRRSESDQVWLDRWNDTIDALRAALEQEKFCDAHCTWANHHPDCEIGNKP